MYMQSGASITGPTCTSLGKHKMCLTAGIEERQYKYSKVENPIAVGVRHDVPRPTTNGQSTRCGPTFISDMDGSLHLPVDY